MSYCRRLLQADILPQKLSRRKAIVMFAGAVGRRLDQHRNMESRKSQSIGDAAFFAKVGQCDDNSIDLFAMALEEFCAA